MLVWGPLVEGQGCSSRPPWLIDFLLFLSLCWATLFPTLAVSYSTKGNNARTFWDRVSIHLSLPLSPGDWFIWMTFSILWKDAGPKMETAAKTFWETGSQIYFFTHYIPPIQSLLNSQWNISFRLQDKIWKQCLSSGPQENSGKSTFCEKKEL